MRTYETKQALRAWKSWTGGVDELAALASIFIWGLGLEPAPSTTAGDVITRRTIRYYTTRGVLSPPQGQTRSATYHYRHLLELLLIKAGQNRGFTLDTIQSWGDAETVESLETRILGEVDKQTARPLPNDHGIFVREDPATVLRYWRHTLPYAQRDYADSSSAAPVRSLSPAAESRSQPGEPPQEPEQSGPVPADRSQAAREAELAPYYNGNITGQGALRERVHLQLAPGIELVLSPSHKLVQDPDYRSRFVENVIRWLLEDQR